MKRQRPSDAEVKAALRYGYPSHHLFDPMLNDLLRCRRALRRILRLSKEEPGWLAVGIECIAEKALGKGEKS